MCLTVKKDCKPEIAKKDILCWKAVVEEGPNEWTPVFFFGLEPYNKVLFAKVCGGVLADEHLFIHDKGILGTKLPPSNWTIDEGFHAFRNLYGIINGIEYTLPVYVKWKLHFCIIPKGAEYCKGTDGQIVSTKIIVFRSFKDYLKYKLKWK